jgi:hypothetical protein
LGAKSVNPFALRIRAWVAATKAVSSALALAQTKVEAACMAPDVIAAAKANAETVLKGSFGAVGWNTRVQWK